MFDGQNGGSGRGLIADKRYQGEVPMLGAMHPLQNSKSGDMTTNKVVFFFAVKTTISTLGFIQKLLNYVG